MTHFTPLDTIFNHSPSTWSIKIFTFFAPAGRDRKLLQNMGLSWRAPALCCAFFLCGSSTGFSQGQQAPNDAVRVTMSMHPDGSRTVYNFDNAQHTAVATTT